jgi:hypothetical protein
MRAEALVGANLLMLLAGLGLLPLLRVAHSWRELAYRSGLAYLCGILLAGILSAHLALVQVGFGWAGLATLAVVSLAACFWRLRGSERPSWVRPGWIHVAGVVAVAAVIADYVRAFRVAPLNRYDAWAIWALKGHALYAFGWADPTVFAGSAYRFANLDYPLLLPSLEAIAFRSMGAFDTRLIHVQFLFLLVAALAALFALLRDRVPAVVLWLSLFAIAVAPAVFDQLLTAYADLPLALVFCVGVAASGRWLLANERWALAAAVDVMLLLPWRIYVHVHHLRDINYSFGDSFDYGHLHGRLGVGRIAFRTLGGQMLDAQQWGFLVPLFAVLVLAAFVAGSRALPIFALVWAGLAWIGLSWIYVISRFEYSSYLDSTKERVVATIVLGGAALIPLLAAETWARLSARERAPLRSGDGAAP